MHNRYQQDFASQIAAYVEAERRKHIQQLKEQAQIKRAMLNEKFKNAVDAEFVIIEG